MGEEFIPEQKAGGAFVREVYDWVESGITAIICVILVFTFVGRLVGVNGESMFPTLHHMDRLVATNFLYTPKNGDIVVITKPNTRHEPLIKRVIAIGGQTLDVDFETSSVYVDGELIDEPYLREPMNPDYSSEMNFPLTVPEGCIFVMGDNRNNSWDSRVEQVGFVDQRHILGKIIYRIMPYEDMGIPQ